MSLVNTIPWDTDLHFCHGWNLELWIRSFVYKYQISKFPKKLFSCHVISLTSPLQYIVWHYQFTVWRYIYWLTWATWESESQRLPQFTFLPRGPMFCVWYLFFHGHWSREVTQQTSHLSHTEIKILLMKVWCFKNSEIYHSGHPQLT